MISLTCTSCKKVLQIDDAFAGGVCRCQHCGTIQTVPASLKNSPNASGTGSRTLYQRKAQATAAEAGIAVAESTTTPPSTAADTPAAETRARASAPESTPDRTARKLPTAPLVIAAAIIVVIALIILLAD